MIDTGLLFHEEAWSIAYFFTLNANRASSIYLGSLRFFMFNW